MEMPDFTADRKIFWEKSKEISKNLDFSNGRR